MSMANNESESDNEDYLLGIQIDVLEETKEEAEKLRQARLFCERLKNDAWRISNQNIQDEGKGVHSIMAGTTSIKFSMNPELGQQFKAWDCSIVLSMYLEKFLKDNKTNPRILELGCGIGLPSVAAALLCPGASVVATDLAMAQSIVEENIALNGLNDQVSFRPFIWGGGSSLSELLEWLPFDIILCSDLIFTDAESVDKLTQTLEECCAHGTLILSCHENRYGAQSTPYFFDRLEHKGFIREMVGLAEVSMEWQNNDRIILMKITRAPLLNI